MRIRKNARLSSLLALSSPPPLQSHVCQLNQSPWDVIPFSHDSSPPTSSFHRLIHHQLEGDDSLTGDARFGDSLRAFDSGIDAVVDDDFDTRKWKQEEALDDNQDDDDNYNGIDNDSYYQGDNTGGDPPGTFVMIGGCCKRTNGKGWQCSREAKEGHYLCEHHLKPNHNINNSLTGGFGSNESSASSVKRGGPSRRGRPSKKGPSSKPSETNNSNQFYYYSGFGPSWGRRRTEKGGCGGGREELRIEAGEESSGRSSGTPPPSARISGEEEEIDYAVGYGIDEEDEEEGIGGERGGGGRKRTRKPVKARSLKSLM